MCEENAQALHEVEMRRKATEFRQAIESTLTDAQQLLQEQAAKHADDTARVEAKNARTIDMMAHQNGLLQDELGELKRYEKHHDLREDGSKPKRGRRYPRGFARVDDRRHEVGSIAKVNVGPVVQSISICKGKVKVACYL